MIQCTTIRSCIDDLVIPIEYSAVYGRVVVAHDRRGLRGVGGCCAHRSAEVRGVVGDLLDDLPALWIM